MLEIMLDPRSIQWLLASGGVLLAIGLVLLAFASAQSAAAATVLGKALGDSVAFEDSTGISIGNGVRRFESFRAAAYEAGISRIYGGIHFPYGNMGGRALGECVGGKVVERLKVAAAR